MIIGSGPYTNANASITVHNPSIQTTGNFVLTLTGLANPVVTGAIFSPGTGLETFLRGGLHRPTTFP